jgi:hypothetical protein
MKEQVFPETYEGLKVVTSFQVVINKTKEVSYCYKKNFTSLDEAIKFAKKKGESNFSVRKFVETEHDMLFDKLVYKEKVN